MKNFIAALVLVAGLAGSGAAHAEWKMSLPEGGAGFNFGNLIIPGLNTVTSQTVFNEKNGFGFTSGEGLVQGGGQWPDPLSGTFVYGNNKEIEFHAKVPNGTYLVWLCAGKLIRADLQSRHYLLKLNGTALCDETPNDDALLGEKYLCRFLFTQYSNKPHALWENYIDKMYPSSVQTVTVTDGMLSLSAANHFLSAMIAVPAEKKADFDALLTAIHDKRLELFEKTLKDTRPKPPEKKPGDGDVLVYAPLDPAGVQPWSVPSDDERKRTTLNYSGAPGQRVAIVLAVVPFVECGASSLVLNDLKGPGTIPAAAISGYFKNWRYRGGGEGTGVDELSLVPSLKLNVEAGLTQTFWLWLHLPEDAKAGLYKGTFSFKPEKGAAVDVPVELDVYPFKLQSNVPVAYGMWGTGYFPPFLTKEVKRKVFKDRLEWMREIGFTSFEIEAPQIKSVSGDEAVVEIDPEPYELAKETGMARRPEQGLLLANIMAGPGRKLGSILPGSAGVYKNPGIELRQPDFKKYFTSMLRQYHDFLEKTKVPVVVTAVDEPRERAINSWNRNLADTLVYCDMIRDAKLTCCCNPMYDTTHGKDYTPLIDHVDVLSTHGWKNSEKFMNQTIEKKKTLWLYNCGQDRYSWGFYNWRSKSSGKFEWHFGWPEDDAVGGYPGRDWYNPFTSLSSATSLAPYSKYKGGLLFVSRFFSMAEGITDYTYIYTLEEALKSDAASKNTKVAADARAFLNALERAMPQFPDVKGLASANDGPAVGMGIQDEARTHVDDWRKTIAKFLIELNPPTH